jgi:hypothetical protein
MPQDTMMGPGSMEMADESPDTEPMNSPEEQNEGEQADVFLSKENLGGRTVKAGDTLTLTVRDVDPETGDVQASLDSGAGETSGEGYGADFDKAVPMEE